MIVYADVLIVMNIFITFVLLTLTAKLNMQQNKTFRLILGSICGGFCSLIILLPSINILIDILYKLLSAALIILITFGYIKLKIFLRNVFVFFTQTYVFAGIIFSVWYLFKPQNILINNSTVYFDISVTYLIILTILIYFCITTVSSVIKREAISAKKCNVNLCIENKILKLNAIIDTGNSLDDVFGSGETITISEREIKKLCGNTGIIQSYPKRYRILPCKTVTGENILEGIRCDWMRVSVEGKTFDFKNPIAVVSKSNFSDDFDAILNSEILMKMR